MNSLIEKVEIDSAKSQSPYSEMSSKYRFMNTLDISNVFYERGWDLKLQTEAKVFKNKNRQGFQKHMLIFENPDFTIPNEGNIQLVVRNSHEGTSTMELFYGFMRIHCSNQLFVKSLGKGETFKVKHKGSREMIEEKLELTLNSVISGLDFFKDKVSHLYDVKMDEGQKIQYARSVMDIRYADRAEYILKHNPDLLNNILNPLRSEDYGDEAWKVYNVVQEKFTKGSKDQFQFVVDADKNRKASIRSLNSVVNAPEFNQKIWEAMSELVGVAN